MIKRYIFIVCALIAHTMIPVTFHNPDDTAHVSYIYVPGIFATESQAARYVSPFVASTGETVRCNGIQVIQQPITAVTFNEVTLKKTNDNKYNPITWTKKLYYGFFTWCYRKFADIVIEGVSNNDRSIAAFWIKPWKLNFGQEADIKILRDAYNAHLNHQKQQAPDKKQKVAFYAVSRGTAALLNFLKEKPEAAAGVFESAIDSMENVFTRLVSRIKELSKKLEKVCAYKSDGIAPLDDIEKIDKNLPLLFVTSIPDNRVPLPCTVNLYNTLREKGYEKVYLHVLEKSPHSGYTSDNENDKNSYEKVVHAFWAHCNLPHDTDLAASGNSIFAQCQPTRQELEERIKKPI